MRIIFTGGGTAGHINPGLAVAKHILRQDTNAEIRFGGATKGIEEKLVAREGFMLYTYPIRGFQRDLSPTGCIANVKAFANIFGSIKKAKADLKAWKPDIVVGTGGYASFPLVYAAAKMGIKTAMLEVNATPGIAVKYLAPLVDSVMLSFQESAKLVPKAKHTQFTGSPIRGDVLHPPKSKPTFSNGLPTVLCFWGSVGAQYMNEKMCDFIKLAAEERLFNVLHTPGSRDYQWMPEKLKTMGIDLKQTDNICVSEYIYDMGAKMQEASLIMCRGGASSLVEVCGAGKAAVVVPSPYVPDNHQEKNARLLEKNGCCTVLLEKETTGLHMYQTVKGLLADGKLILSMGEQAKKMAVTDGAQNIYNEIKRITAK